MENTTGIIVRTDLYPYSQDVAGIHYFCRTCDPEGKGTGYGHICNKHEWDTEEKLKDKYRFCPHCGRKLNYADKKERIHRMTK